MSLADARKSLLLAFLFIVIPTHALQTTSSDEVFQEMNALKLHVGEDGSVLEVAAGVVERQYGTTIGDNGMLNCGYVHGWFAPSIASCKLAATEMTQRMAAQNIVWQYEEQTINDPSKSYGCLAQLIDGLPRIVRTLYNTNTNLVGCDFDTVSNPGFQQMCLCVRCNSSYCNNRGYPRLSNDPPNPDPFIAAHGGCECDCHESGDYFGPTCNVLNSLVLCEDIWELGYYDGVDEVDIPAFTCDYEKAIQDDATCWLYGSQSMKCGETRCCDDRGFSTCAAWAYEFSAVCSDESNILQMDVTKKVLIEHGGAVKCYPPSSDSLETKHDCSDELCCQDSIEVPGRCSEESSCHPYGCAALSGGAPYNGFVFTFVFTGQYIGGETMVLNDQNRYWDSSIICKKKFCEPLECCRDPRDLLVVDALAGLGLGMGSVEPEPQTIPCINGLSYWTCPFGRKQIINPEDPPECTGEADDCDAKCCNMELEYCDYLQMVVWSAAEYERGPEFQKVTRLLAVQEAETRELGLKNDLCQEMLANPSAANQGYTSRSSLALLVWLIFFI